METTSSPTSERPSNEFRARALSAWLVVVAIQVGLAFWSQTLEGSDTEPLYEYDLAIGSFFAYGILIGITFWIASAYQDRTDALGLRPYVWRWLGIAAAGKTYADLVQAFSDLGLDDRGLKAAGIRVLKIGMVWPLLSALVLPALLWQMAVRLTTARRLRETPVDCTRWAAEEPSGSLEDLLHPARLLIEVVWLGRLARGRIRRR